MTERAKGHTLAELLVALCLLSLLAAGLLRFLGAGLGALTRTGEALAAQRSLRRATAQLTDELAEMGFVVPCRIPEPGRPWFQLARQRPLQQLSGRSLTALQGGRTAGGDELTFLKDEVLPGPAVLARALSPQVGPGPACGVAVAAAPATRLHPGDLLLIEDGGWEGARVLATVDLAPGRTVEVPTAPLEAETPQVFRRDHAPGAPVTFLRPCRVVQYRLVHLHKGRAVRSVPALVRLEAGCGPGEPDWAGLLRGGTEAEASARVVAEGIAGFRVDLPRGQGPPGPPLVKVTLVAQRPGGLSREATFLCAPRNFAVRP